MITLTDAKLNIRVSDEATFEDDLIADLVSSATAYLERRIGWHLGPVATRTAWVYGNGTRTIWLPQPPLLDSVEIEDLVEDEDFGVRGARLIRLDGVWRYGQEYTITYEAGFATGEGPPDLLQAVRLIVAGWYEHREAWASGTITADHKQGVDRLVGAYERVRV